ncbi:hypothetical protein C8R44DRAFT_812290, partial [Mycena epipterygia]
FVIDEGVDTTPGPPWDISEEDDRSTPMSPQNTDATDNDPVKLQTNWNQSKPSTRS